MSTHPIRTAPRPLNASIRPPGSKSHTIRALFLAALANGISRLHHPLDSDDTRFARAALRGLGVGIDDRTDPWVVHGSGGSLAASPQPLDAGASGLTGRALIAVAPLAVGSTTVTGRDRLPSRPMRGLVEALGALGVDVADTDGRLPVTVHGSGALKGGEVGVACQETSQFLSALLLVSPMAEGGMTITPVGLEGSVGYVDVTLGMMEVFGGTVTRHEGAYRVEPSRYEGAEIEIEPDASAAVYPMVAAAIAGGRVTIQGLGLSSIQPDMEVARVLADMGCEVEQGLDETTVVSSGPPLRSIDADLSGCPDGSLAVAVACLYGDGTSRLRGLGSLRFKESDRLEAIATEIRRIGGRASIEGETLLVAAAPLHPATIEAHGDHRIAMSMALAGLVEPGLLISNPSVVNKTWPGFWEMLEGLAG